MKATTRLTEHEKEVLRQAGQILNRVRSEKVSPARRREIAVNANIASLKVRRENKRKREEEQRKV